MRTALSWLQTILLDAVGPIVVYQIMSGNGFSTVTSLLVSGVTPVISLLITVALERKLNEIGMLVVTFLVLSVIATLLFADPRILLLKESAVTGLFGLVFLGSLWAPRPLTFFFGRKFATGGNPARVQWWNDLWRYEGFRQTQRHLTIVWAVVLIVEALARAALTYALTVDTMVTINAIVPFVIIAGLVAYTIWYGRRAQARATAAGVDTTPPAESVAPEAAPG